MKNILKRAITIIATTTLAVGLIGACTLREEEHKMEQCGGTIFDLPSAIWTPIIDGVPFLVVNGAKATVIDGTPQADIRVYWLDGDNAPSNLNETLKLGESATLEKVGTFTLIGMDPPARGKRWPDPVVCFEQDPQLMDTARQYAADNDLYFRPDDEEARQP